MHKDLKILHRKFYIVTTRVLKVLCEKILSYEESPSFRWHQMRVCGHIWSRDSTMVFDRECTAWQVSSLGMWLCLVSACSHWVSSYGTLLARRKAVHLHISGDKLVSKSLFTAVKLACISFSEGPLRSRSDQICFTTPGLQTGGSQVCYWKFALLGPRSQLPTHFTLFSKVRRKQRVFTGTVKKNDPWFYLFLCLELFTIMKDH